MKDGWSEGGIEGGVMEEGKEGVMEGMRKRGNDGGK